MALREQLDQPTPTRQPGGVLPDEMTPVDLEDSMGLKPAGGTMPPGNPGPYPKVMTADASGNVPLPERRPAETQPLDLQGATPQTPPDETAGAPAPLVDPSKDSRYGDDHWIAMNYVLTQGALPWLQAASDVASGRVPPEKFEQARIEHSKAVQAVIDKHPDFVAAAQKAAPLLSGLGMGMFGNAGTVGGTIARGTGVGAIMGATQGYTGGDPETPDLSRERGVGATEGAVVGGVLGASGAAGAEAGRAIVKGARAGSAARTASKAADEAASVETARKQDIRDKAVQRREQAKADQAQQDKLAGQFEELRKPPAEPHDTWQTAREQFNSDPGRAWAHFTGPGNWPKTLQELSLATNLPKAVVASKLDKLDLNPNTPERIKLYQEIKDAMASRTAYQSRSPDAKTPAPAPAAPAPAAEQPQQPNDFGYRMQQREKMIPDQTPQPDETPAPLSDWRNWGKPRKAPAAKPAAEPKGEPSAWKGWGKERK